MNVLSLMELTVRLTTLEETVEVNQRQAESQFASIQQEFAAVHRAIQNVELRLRREIRDALDQGMAAMREMFNTHVETILESVERHSSKRRTTSSQRRNRK